MSTFYATFGSQSAFRKHYLIVEAPDKVAARATMLDHFSNKWSMLYDPAGFEGQVEKYGLTCIGTLTDDNLRRPFFKGA